MKPIAILLVSCFIFLSFSSQTFARTYSHHTTHIKTHKIKTGLHIHTHKLTIHYAKGAHKK
jgi:hypothetical protein